LKRKKEREKKKKKKKKKRKEPTSTHIDLSLWFTRTDVCAIRAPGLALACLPSSNRPILAGQTITGCNAFFLFFSTLSS
jgi:hypothetical protein